jgi:hypothetical protein
MAIDANRIQARMSSLRKDNARLTSPSPMFRGAITPPQSGRVTARAAMGFLQLELPDAHNRPALDAAIAGEVAAFG